MPAWTAVTQYVLFKEKLSWNVYVTLIPIIGGAMMVCKGEVRAVLLSKLDLRHILWNRCLAIKLLCLNNQGHCDKKAAFNRK